MTSKLIHTYIFFAVVFFFGCDNKKLYLQNFHERGDFSIPLRPQNYSDTSIRNSPKMFHEGYYRMLIGRVKDTIKLENILLIDDIEKYNKKEEQIIDWYKTLASTNKKPNKLYKEKVGIIRLIFIDENRFLFDMVNNGTSVTRKKKLSRRDTYPIDEGSKGKVKKTVSRGYYSFKKGGNNNTFIGELNFKNRKIILLEFEISNSGSSIAIKNISSIYKSKKNRLPKYSLYNFNDLFESTGNLNSFHFFEESQTLKFPTKDEKISIYTEKIEIDWDKKLRTYFNEIRTNVFDSRKDTISEYFGKPIPKDVFYTW